MKQPQNGVCPVCGAAVQENALFCLHCMTSFDEKTKIPPPAQKKRGGVWAAVLGCVLVLLGVVIFFVLRNNPPADPAHEAGTEQKQEQEQEQEQKQDGARVSLIDFDTFRTAVILTSERLDCDDFWDADGFLDVEYYKETNTERCTTDIFLSGARLDLFFRNGGDVITLILSDVPTDRLNEAKLLCSAVHAAVTNHYSDIHKILTDDGTYHRFDAKDPYVDFFTDMTGRTERYAADLAAGTRFSTRYTLIDDENKTDDDFTVFFETERESAGTKLYDLILRFDYYSNEEVNVGAFDDTE